MDSDDKSLTILMYPWFAMGHLFPYVSTANKLAERGHKIYVIIPPKTRPKLEPLNLHPDHIQYIPMPIPHVEGLPNNVETTNDGLTFVEKQLLRHALDLTHPLVRSLLSDLSPDFVFYDFMHWLPGLARDMHIKSVHYSVVSPAAVSFLFADHHSLSLSLSEEGFTQSIHLNKHTAAGLKFIATAKEMGSGITLMQRLITSFCESDAIGFKTCDEIDGDYSRFLEKKLKKPVILAGPVNPKPQSVAPLDEKWANWLQKFDTKTVIFCAFGSECVLKLDQFEELLLGIEETGYPFLIALKPPLGFDAIEAALPDGFKNRIGENGVVHGGWVPQQAILKHPAVGCFVTHCGSGSMWEGLMSECQLVALPHVGEHHIHARLLSGVLKVGVEIHKGDEDGLFTKQGVRAAIMAAMAKGSTIGEEVRQNHDRLRELMQSHGFRDSYFDSFVRKLHALLHLN